MSSNGIAIEFCEVWKKYSREAIFHRSLREDLTNLFKGRRPADLAKSEFWALKDTNFTVRKGEALGLYGPNGAGKTTILKLIAGVTYPNRGTIRAEGKVAPILEVGAGFHPDLTGRENIFVNGAILGMRIPEIQQKMSSIIDFSKIKEFIDMPVKKYSSGMYLRLAFAIAIHSEADIYLFDEIISVGDADFQNKCLTKIVDLKSAGTKTILFVSHQREILKRMANRIFYVENGKLSEQKVGS